MASVKVIDMSYRISSPSENWIDFIKPSGFNCLTIFTDDYVVWRYAPPGRPGSGGYEIKGKLAAAAIAAAIREGLIPLTIV